MKYSTSAVKTLQNAAVASGNGQALTCDGYSTVLVQILSSIAMSGGTTINFEASPDGGTTWTAIPGLKTAASGTSSSTSTADGDFRFDVSGYGQFRARISAWSAGTTTIKAVATMAPLAAATTINFDGEIGAVEFKDGSSDNRAAVSSTGAVSVNGSVAHDAVDTGNPLKVGGKAETTAPSAVADADRVDAFFDEFGRLIVRNKARTGTVTSQADQATNVTLLALNELRLGASIVNESSSILYVKCGATATSSSYTIALAPMGSVGSYWEVPFGYTGIIDGIWSADSTGSARITEWT